MYDLAPAVMAMFTHGPPSVCICNCCEAIPSESVAIHLATTLMSLVGVTVPPANANIGVVTTGGPPTTGLNQDERATFQFASR